MMVAAEISTVEPALTVTGASKLAAPDHEGVLQQAAVLEIGNEGGEFGRCLLYTSDAADD